MPARDVLRRMAANLAGCRIKSIREKPTAREMDALSAAVTSLYAMPLTIVDNLASLTVIEAEARRLIRLKKADVVVVDYVQLVQNDGPETREACVAEVARKLKNLALSGQCAVLTASQLNEDGRMRESRAIGHHADHVITSTTALWSLARTVEDHAMFPYLSRCAANLDDLKNAQS